MKLDQLARDKALHAIGGGLVASAAAAVAVLIGKPLWAWWCALFAALLAGGLVELRQWRANKKLLSGAMPRDVSPQDVAATLAGGVPVALPLLLLFLKG